MSLFNLTTSEQWGVGAFHSFNLTLGIDKSCHIVISNSTSPLHVQYVCNLHVGIPEEPV